MDVLLQSHETKRIFPIPEGLKELTSDIVREVLRHQPECIHSFVAEYLETMLVVRERARDSAVVVSDIYRQGYFLEDLFVTKKVTREEVDGYASIIQAAWKGYVVRKKLRMYLQKRRKIQEERERKRAMKIEDFLDSIGITYEEATRAACLIQSAFREARRGKWVVNDAGEEVWMEGEGVPMGQRIRQSDIAHGRYDRWDKRDWGEFFEMTEEGEIMFDWPRIGQVFKLPRKLLRPDMEVMEFFAMRDLNGKEQYSYMKEPQKERDPRGFPIGFLVPLHRELIQESSAEVGFVNPIKSVRMGNYSYVFEKTIEKEDLNQFVEVLADRKAVNGRTKTYGAEYPGEFDYDPEWVVPRVMIQIRKDCLTEADDEVMFLNEGTAPLTNGVYTFRAENTELSLRVIKYILKSTCATIEEAMADAVNIKEYKQRSTGRILAVENFDRPRYIQKVVIVPETKTGEYENENMDKFEYVFVPRGYKWRTRAPKAENPIEIPIARFQGYHSNYRGSSGLDNMTFIMGPMLHSPDGKHFTYDSLFWDEFGPECWYQLLCEIANKKIARLGEAVEEEEEEEEVEEDAQGEEEATEESEAGEVTKSPDATSPTVITQPAPPEVKEETVTEQKVAEPEPKLEAEVDQPKVEEPSEVPAVEATEQEPSEAEKATEPQVEATEPAAEEQQPAESEQ